MIMETVKYIISSVLLGFGLAMDAFSVSVVNGFREPHMRTRKKNLIALCFGGFQTLMPMIGWAAVTFFLSLFKKAEPVIPWVAFGLLLFIGGKMVMEGIMVLRGKTDEADEVKTLGKHTLFVQGIATSIDALSVGFTISGYGFVKALAVSLIIGLVTFVLCRLALVLGIRLGRILNRYASLVGGIILIGIGLEILLSNLLADL